MMGDLELIVTHSVRCRGCGYHRYLTDSEAANWKRGEYYSGSQKCPGCAMTPQSSAAQWIATKPMAKVKP